MTTAARLRLGLLLGVGGVLLSSVATAAGPFQFFSITPCRIIDTRNPNGPTGGPALAAQVARNFPITNQCGIPSDAKAAVLNVVIVGPTGSGNFRLWPYNTTMPLVATLNFDQNEPALANGAIVPLSADPTFSVSGFLQTGTGTNAHLVIDATGYFK